MQTALQFFGTAVDRLIPVLEETNRKCGAEINAMFSIFLKAAQEEELVYFAGNGGSDADAQDWASELLGRYRIPGRAIAAVSLTGCSPVTSANANDYGYAEVFARQGEAHFKPGRVFVAITTSGTSQNILEAIEVARKNRTSVIVLTGAKGTGLKDHPGVTVCIAVPSEETARIQETHRVLMHAICETLDVTLKEEKMQGELVTFDLEGTCVDLEGLHFLAFERALEKFDIHMSTDEISDLPGTVGAGDQRVAEILAEFYPGQFSVSDYLAEKNRHFDILIAEEPMAAREGVMDVIREAKARGCQVAIASLTPRERGEVIVTRSGLGRLVPSKHVLFLEDVPDGRKKPAPDVFLQTAKRAGVSPDKQLVFEDSPTGVEAARAAGSVVYALPPPIFQGRPEHLERLRAAGAAGIFMSWREVNLHTLLERIL